MKNKNTITQGNISFNGDSNQNTIKQNKQSNINKSKTIIKTSKPDKYKEEVQVPWANVYNPSAILYKRTPYINDRPILEIYYNALKIPGENKTKPILMYGYIASKYKNRNDNINYILTNTVSVFGKHLAAHTVIHGMNLDDYLHELIMFDGEIYAYPSEDKSCLKYGIRIIEYTIDVIETKEHDYIDSPWNFLYQENRDNINTESECINYNSLSKEAHIKSINEIKQVLDTISQTMFGIPGLIYPTIVSSFLMRDDVDSDDIIFLNDNHRHINILSTLVVDYIIKLSPKTYEELYKIVAYVVFNYLGYEVENPSVGRVMLYEFTKYMGISKVQVDYYIENVKRNVGGIPKLKDIIPNNYKTKPGIIHEIGVIQFAKRLYYNC